MTNPFTLHEASITLTIGNITHMLRSYLACSWLDHVIFPYGFHGPRQRIWETVVSDIQDLSHVFVPITLTCDENENVARMTSDGRDDSRIKRALSVRHIYDELRYPKLDTTGLTIDQTADWVISLVNDRTR